MPSFSYQKSSTNSLSSFYNENDQTKNDIKNNNNKEEMSSRYYEGDETHNESSLSLSRRHDLLCYRRRFLSVAAVLLALGVALALNHIGGGGGGGGGIKNSILLDDDKFNIIEEPNPPIWPDDNTVRIFHPNDDTTNIVQTIKELTSNVTDRIIGHFSNERYAFIFHPGKYDFEYSTFEVGYYVQILGLGKHATDVQFINGGPKCSAMDKRVKGGAGSLDTFWRSIENVQISNNGNGNGNENEEEAFSFVWAVSQASPLRRLQIDGNLDLFEGYCVDVDDEYDEYDETENGQQQQQQQDCGAYYASGGYMANINVDGYVNFGSQQQFMSRNVNFNGGSGGGAWNLVFEGCYGDHLNQTNFWDGQDLVRTNEDIPRVRAEKPYIIVENENENEEEEGSNSPTTRYKLVVPKAIITKQNNKHSAHHGLMGATLSTDPDENDIRDFSKVRLARPSDTYESIQLALDAGLDVVFSPGIYDLGRTLTITQPGTVILGLGLATLLAPKDGSPILHVAPESPDVRVAGFILEANVLRSKEQQQQQQQQHHHDYYVDAYGMKYPHSTLLIWGSPGIDDPGDKSRPGVLSDIFCRVGGTTYDRNASVEIMVELYSENIVGDHLWLWRPDHISLHPEETQVWKNDENQINSEFYLVQPGDCTSTTGLQVMGDDVTIYGLSAEHFTGDMVIWRGERGQVRFYQSELPYEVTQDNYGNRGYVSYLVDEYVQSHNLKGGGVYSYFRDHDVTVQMAFRHPSNNNISMTNIFTRFLNGHGSINSIVNMKGKPVTSNHRLSRIEFSED